METYSSRKWLIVGEEGGKSHSCIDFTTYFTLLLLGIAFIRVWPRKDPISFKDLKTNFGNPQLLSDTLPSPYLYNYARESKFRK